MISFIRWIETLYNNSSAHVLQNGFLTTSISISRGCRQGDLIASFLFLIGAQILNVLCHQNEQTCGIKLNEKEYKIAQYADDTEFFLDGTKTSLQATLETLKYFEEISGLKVNMEKWPPNRLSLGGTGLPTGRSHFTILICYWIGHFD